jgi:hypothetical protein
VGGAAVLSALACSPVTVSGASPSTSPSIIGCWQFNNQDYAFSIGAASTPAQLGILVDTQTTDLNSESCDTDVPVGTLSGSITKGVGYVTSGNKGWAITGIKGTTMTGYVYWVGATAPPTPAPSYGTCESDHEANPDSGWDCFQFTATNVAPPNPTPPSTAKLSVALTGEKGTSPNSVAVTLTLTNAGSTDISGLGFTDPTGLENDGVTLAKGNIGPTQSGLALIKGPTPALPTTLPAKGTVTVHYTFSAISSGDAVLVADATGTGDGAGTVTSKAALTVYVTSPPVTAGDYRKVVTSALLAADSITDQGQNAMANAEAVSLASALNLPPASPGQQAAAIQAGLPPQVGALVGAVKNSDLEQWVANYYNTLSTDLSGGASYLGQTGKALEVQLLAVATDPEKQDEIMGRLWDGLKALPSKTQSALASQADNLGYLGQALMVSLTPAGQFTAGADDAAAGIAALKTLQSNVQYAVDGFTAAQVADVTAYKNDPTGYLNANSSHYATATYDLIKTELVTLIGGGVGKAVGAVTGFGSVAADANAIDSTVAASVDSTAPVAADTTAAAMKQANVATSQFQTLPVGTPLPVDQAAQLGGLVPGDQQGVQTSLNFIKKKFGVELELGVRTSEPLSLGIDGSAKLTFMKPKAVSLMDMTIGAPSEIAAYTAPGDVASGQVFRGGVVTVFKPVPIPEDTLAAIGETNLAYVDQYKVRIASQNDLWNDWMNPNSTLRVLVQASADSPLVEGSSQNRIGVTAIAAYPGFAVPAPPPGAQPLIYLQQLDQPAFVEQFGMTTEQAQALKTSLSRSPGAEQINYIARPNPDGSVSFFDGLQNNIPSVSDFDLQFIQPANGAAWPAGMQSTIEQQFKDQLEKNVSRLPNHGASASATDLPAQDIAAADKFVLGTSDPAFAQAVADNLATRYASQSAIFASNAARLEAQALLVSDPTQAKALRTLAAIYRQTAAKFANVDAAYLLKKYPPGEKIIVIKLGDVRVGYGAAPKS